MSAFWGKKRSDGRNNVKRKDTFIAYPFDDSPQTYLTIDEALKAIKLKKMNYPLI